MQFYMNDVVLSISILLQSGCRTFTSQSTLFAISLKTTLLALLAHKGLSGSFAMFDIKPIGRAYAFVLRRTEERRTL